MSEAAVPAGGAQPHSERLGSASIFTVIGASAVGTMIEWYDFYIFGTLAPIIAAQFYPPGNETLATLQVLATFAAGFAARPFGALVFGRLGDLIGRKYAFLATLLIMGGATFIIGLLPGYATLGFLAPLILLLLRLVQGLALGGEYGGAATYVAEHVPDNRRGYYTAYIQTTATLGLFMSLLVILLVRGAMPTEAFNAWGWRIPFLISILLVGLSLFIRLRLQESPLFKQMKSAGHTSKAPIGDSFGTWPKWQTVLTVLWGMVAGQAVVWYTGQFYALTWLRGKGTAGVPAESAEIIVAVALALATPFFIVFGALSDRVGRKPVILTGCLLAALLTIPIFQVMYQFTPNGGSYNPVVLTALVFILVLFVTMVYGPIAAFLVESFPAKVRYTSVSLPYHIGNGYFGGFLPFIAAAVAANAARNPGTGIVADQYSGLIYPVVVATITFVLGLFLIRETKDNPITAEAAEPTEKYPANPLVLALVVGLTLGALWMADQYLMPTLSDDPGTASLIQWFFRGLFLLIVVAIGMLLYRRRGYESAPSTASAR
ncbi:MAG: MFS transporter [Chloroflexota bacterium]|nr:MFS transporter [Chloroflexota bacterium]